MKQKNMQHVSKCTVAQKVALVKINILFLLLCISCQNKTKTLTSENETKLDSIRIIERLIIEQTNTSLSCQNIGFKEFKTNDAYFCDSTLVSKDILQKVQFYVNGRELIKNDFNTFELKSKSRLYYSGGKTIDLCIGTFGDMSINGNLVKTDTLLFAILSCSKN